MAHRVTVLPLQQNIDADHGENLLPDGHLQ